MLILLPIGAFAAIYLSLLGWPTDPSETNRREALVGAWVVWGVLLVLGLEALSAARAIHMAALAGWWLAAGLAVILLGWRRGAIGRGWLRLRGPIGGLSRADRLLLGGTTLLLAAVFLVAVISPSNNVDSLNHHMVRVVHWAQDGTLEPYATNRNGQISKPPLAEMAILNARVLLGTDQGANLVQWTAMVSGLVIVSLLAFRLGAARREQWLAVAFAFSIPLGVLMASSTKNDHVVALWVLCLVSFALASATRRLRRVEIVLAGLALGLGLLTKGTFQVFAFPFLVWLFVALVTRAGWQRGGLQILIILALAGLLNLPYWARNVRTFGGPFGNPLGLARALEVDELSGAGPGTGENEVPTGQVVEDSGGPIMLVSRRFVSMLALNTIYPEVGASLRGWLARIPGLFPSGFLASLDEGAWNHEDSAGSLLHLAILSISIVVLGIVAVRRRDVVVGGYLLALVAGYAALTLVSAATDLWGLRYQFTFFVVGAPLVAAFAKVLSRGWLTSGVTVLLLLAAVPYIALNSTRPFVPAYPRTRPAGILTAPRVEVLSNTSPRLTASYEAAADVLRTSSCREVGLDLRRGDLEYIAWWTLAAPQSGFRIETVAPSPETSRFQDPAFSPCALLCTRCGDKASAGGLPLNLDLGYLRLYLAEGASGP